MIRPAPSTHFELVTEDEHRLLAEWNATAAAGPDWRVHEFFAGQAERIPDAVALSG